MAGSNKPDRIASTAPSKANAVTEAPVKAPGVFEEWTYLRLNPDVQQAVAAGRFRSGQEHFELFGRIEGRPFVMPEMLITEQIIVTGGLDAPRESLPSPVGALDFIKISHSGGIFLAGWVQDHAEQLDRVDLYFSNWSISLDAQNLARQRREDAESALGGDIHHLLGFWGFLFADRRLAGGLCSVVLRLKSGAELNLLSKAEVIEDDEMRNLALVQLAHASYFGNPYFEAVAAIEATIGNQMVDFNRILSRKAVSAPYVERFGRSDRRYKGSVIVCLYGKVEYMFLQQAMFSKQPGMQDYEFIYVVNSPWIAEDVLKEAKLCALIYGLDMSVVILNSNAGFGAANNLAAEYASSDRLLIMNPDVFPHDPSWAERHTNAIEALPPVQTALFGAPLYYDDGSLMHAGMYFDADTMPHFARPGKLETRILRVEHYGKGAPPDTARFLKPRPVPAVTGAFMSVERDWFEQLSGFTHDYVFGHYEDADLCLKSIRAGRLPWLHDLRLWHLEGKGSTRQPSHEGGSVINRWLFTKTWSGMVQNGLLGPKPTYPGFYGES
ncbi:MAG: hypothetical protein P4L54_03535 [Acidocella sp.]|nr:hypothetical protein [Acidocella sp.]